MLSESGTTEIVTKVGHFDEPQYQVHHHLLAECSEWDFMGLKLESHCFQIGRKFSHLKDFKLDYSK
jgi:hypothetical protein